MEDPIEYKIRSFLARKIGVALAVLVICGFGVAAAAAHDESHGHSPHHHCSHGHHGHDHRHQNHGEEEHQHGEVTSATGRRTKLPEELAEEEDLKLFGFGGGRHHHHDHYHHHGSVADAELSGLGKFLEALFFIFPLFPVATLCV